MRPGGIVRVDGQPGPAIAPLMHPMDGGAILQAVEYVDTVRENRTGVTKYNQGLDANSLNKTMGGLTQIMSASQQRIELIARVIAETGMKTLMLIIHAKKRRDVTVSVGLGTGNKDQMLQHLQMILMAQKEVAPIGLARPKNIYNALVKLTQNAGFKMPDDFWTDPEKAEPMQQPPDPNAAKAQADLEGKKMSIQADGQKTVAQMQAESERQMRQLAFDAEQRHLDREAEMQKAQLASATQIELARVKEESARMATADDREFQAGQDAQNQQREEKGKAESAAMADQRMAAVMDGLQQVMQAMQRPLRLVRGPDGKAAEIH
jgi:hypothetical protein